MHPYLLNTFYALILSCFVLYSFLIFNDLKIVNVRNILPWLILTTIISISTYITFIPTLLLISVLTIVAFVFLYKLEIFKTTISVFVSYFLLALGDTLSGVILVVLFKYSVSEIKTDPYVYFMSHLIIGTIIFLAVNLTKYIKNWFQLVDYKMLKKNKVIIVFFAISLIFISLNSYVYKYTPSYIHAYFTLFNAVTFIVLFIISIIVLNNNTKYITQTNEYEQFKTYTHIIENLYSDLRQFKHDYNNLLISLESYLDNEDLEGLKDYFYKGLINEKKQIGDYRNIVSLNKISESGLKGVLATKLYEAEKKQIQIELDIPNNFNIDEKSISKYDLCKLIGIFLDNSIEACLDSENKKISCGFIKNDKCWTCVISNSFNGDIHINDMFKKGFSTKGPNRGLGLSIVKDTIDKKYPNVLLNTFIENDLLIQELNIF